MRRKEKGITLIALVITIIVLLIITAVTVTTAIRGELFNYAKQAQKETIKRQEEEQSIASGQIIIDGETYDSLQDYRNYQLGILPSAIPGEKVDKKSMYESDGKVAIIPEGFAVSGNSREQSINNGLVIYYLTGNEEVDWTKIDDADRTVNPRAKYDQLVWIPVENPNSMFICQAKTDSNGNCNIVLDNEGNPTCSTHQELTNSEKMAGRLYTEVPFNKNMAPGKYDTNGKREPAVLAAYPDTSENIDTLQEEYNNITKSVIENKGFWAGRYETTWDMNSIAKIIAGDAGTFTSRVWKQLYDDQKTYANSKKCYGGMIPCAAYDQIMIFVDGGYILNDPNMGTYDVNTSGRITHQFSWPYPGGGIGYPATYIWDDIERPTIPYQDMSRNIYDLEGNYYEWTTGANGTNLRITRGGAYSQTSSPRQYSTRYPKGPNTPYGTRIALFVK